MSIEQESNRSTGKRLILSVLIIEDDPLVATTLAEILAELGCDVAGIEHTRDRAEAAAASTNVDLAVVDIDHGGRACFPVANILRSRKIKVVFTTGYGIIGLYGKYSKSPLLPKPFTADTVARVLKRANEERPFGGH